MLGCPPLGSPSGRPSLVMSRVLPYAPVKLGSDTKYTATARPWRCAKSANGGAARMCRQYRATSPRAGHFRSDNVKAKIVAAELKAGSIASLRTGYIFSRVKQGVDGRHPHSASCSQAKRSAHGPLTANDQFDSLPPHYTYSIAAASTPAVFHPLCHTPAVIVSRFCRLHTRWRPSHLGSRVVAPLSKSI